MVCVWCVTRSPRPRHASHAPEQQCASLFHIPPLLCKTRPAASRAACARDVYLTAVHRTQALFCMCAVCVAVKQPAPSCPVSFTCHVFLIPMTPPASCPPPHRTRRRAAFCAECPRSETPPAPQSGRAPFRRHKRLCLHLPKPNRRQPKAHCGL
jgi:hypothetical protein